MKHKCPYSGIDWISGQDLFTDERSIHPHPFFQLSRTKLLVRGRKWFERKYSPEENKLLFLALLHSTEAVHFSVPAYPEHSTVLRNMEALFKIVSWYEGSYAPSLRLCEFRISEDNQQIKEVSNWINSWYSIRHDWLQPSIRRALQEKLEAREDRLLHRIYSPDNPQYLSSLISWALDASKTPEEQKKVWTKILRAKEEELYSYSLEDFLPLEAYMKLNLLKPGSHSAGYAISLTNKFFMLLRTQMKIVAGGRLASIGGLDEEEIPYTFVEQDAQGVEISLGDSAKYYSQRHMRKNIEAVTIKEIVAKSPSEKPLRENYKSLLEYIRAKSAWTLKQQEELKQKLKDSLQSSI